MDDLLSQWRGYASGSAGYCIGFRSSVLSLRARLRKVLYGSEEVHARFRRNIVRRADDEFRRMHEAGKNTVDFTRILTDSVAEFAVQLAPFCKDAAFAAEQEWRLVTLAPKKRRFRQLS